MGKFGSPAVRLAAQLECTRVQRRGLGADIGARGLRSASWPAAQLECARVPRRGRGADVGGRGADGGARDYRGLRSASGDPEQTPHDPPCDEAHAPGELHKHHGGGHEV